MDGETLTLNSGFPLTIYKQIHEILLCIVMSSMRAYHIFTFVCGGIAIGSYEINHSKCIIQTAFVFCVI